MKTYWKKVKVLRESKYEEEKKSNRTARRKDSICQDAAKKRLLEREESELGLWLHLCYEARMSLPIRQEGFMGQSSPRGAKPSV